LDALVEEADRVDRDDERQYYVVIVMLSGDGVDGSPSRPGHIEEMANRLLQHSVEVHNLLFASSQNSFQFRPYGLGTTGIQGRLGDVLARNTRGSFEFFSIATAFATKLPEFGREFARKHRLVSSQYRITYRLPQNPSPQPFIGVGTSRDGIYMIPTLDGNIPTRMPQR